MEKKEKRKKGGREGRKKGKMGGREVKRKRKEEGNVNKKREEGETERKGLQNIEQLLHIYNTVI